MLSSSINKIFEISNEVTFNDIALEVFKFQYRNISIYRDYVDLRKNPTDEITHYSQIPFLPIQFFKSHQVVNKDDNIEKTFLSSGTTKSKRSHHHISDLNLYEKSFLEGFKNNYGDPSDWIILALLPSYLEQGDSSLIYMIDHLIQLTENKNSSYINLKNKDVVQVFKRLKNNKVMLIGVSYALLDLAELKLPCLNNWTIMETGGMKGRKKELIRKELHGELKRNFNVDIIHSEYGMTELLSQSYSKGNGIFSSPPWMKIIIRDLEDPSCTVNNLSSGGINIIDLANIYSCSFIETQDVGKKINKENFEVIGRSDNSEIRGCNLLSI